MALVTYVLGDCPGCKARMAFGNVEVFGDHVFRGCRHCRYRERVDLPPLRKKVLYLDQFFFSHVFRGGDARFIAAADRLSNLASLQLLVAPFSSIHEDETHQWERRGELFDFIRSTSRGNEFKPAYDVEHTQILKSFKAWLEGAPETYVATAADALKADVHQWDSYMRIEVGRYVGDVDLIRDLKKQSVEGLVNLFDGWRQLQTSFEEDLEAEYQVAGQAYMDFYLNFVARIGQGDYMALLNAPIISQVVQDMLHVMPNDLSPDHKLRKCAEFLVSNHFKEAPNQWLYAHMLATLKHRS